MAFQINHLLDSILNNTNEGFIAIDCDGRIKLYNKKAKELFGIDSTAQVDHPEGKLKTGDLVIIADTGIGEDDGNLDYSSLEAIGIYDNSIKHGDPFVAVGAYKEAKIKSQYKIFDSNSNLKNFSFHSFFQGEEINVSINTAKKRVNIEVLGDNYYMDYFHSIGHMVVLDANNHSLKFSQDNGYTARHESVQEILNGVHFRGKGKYRSNLDVINQFIYDIHAKSKIIEQFLDVAHGKDIQFKNRFEEINGFPTLCSLFPVRDKNSEVTAVLKIDDISEINKIIEERNFLSQELNATTNMVRNIPPVRKIFPSISGNSLPMQSVKKMAWFASKNDQPILILGPSGVGKTNLARNIHGISKNKNKPFVHIHCEKNIISSIDNLLYGTKDDLLFIGAFESCRGGTLYISNIDILPLDQQSKLYETIKNGFFYRNKDPKRIQFNGRLFFSSTKNLETEVEEGRFDQKLYSYMQSFQIWIPPLAYRKEDILSLTRDLTEDLCREFGLDTKHFTKEALDLLVQNPLKNNVKELKNLLKETILNTPGKNITPANLKLSSNDKFMDAPPHMTMKEFLENQEKLILIKTLSFYKGNKKEAMAHLDMTKTTFYNKLNKYGLS